MITYVPALKGKSKDLEAFSRVPEAMRRLSKPLVDIPFSSESGAAAIVDRVDAYLNSLAKYVQREQPIFADVYAFRDDETSPNGQPAVLFGLASAIATGMNVTPIVGSDRDLRVVSELRRLVTRTGRGVAIRCDADALVAPEESVGAIEARRAILGLKREACDVIVDLRAMQQVPPRAADKLISFFANLPDATSYRSIVVMGSSALVDVSTVPRDGVLSVPRVELAVWDELIFELAGTLTPIFGDYGIVHPEFAVDGPRPSANAKIRYTRGRQIYYFRGHGLQKPVSDFAQYRALATRVLRSGAYEGKSHSYGDEYIAKIASGPPAGTGNLSTWLVADMNRHLTYAIRQMNGRVESIMRANTLDEISALD
jgi:hypothetical protein